MCAVVRSFLSWRLLNAAAYKTQTSHWCSLPSWPCTWRAELGYLEPVCVGVSILLMVSSLLAGACLGTERSWPPFGPKVWACKVAMVAECVAKVSAFILRFFFKVVFFCFFFFVVGCMPFRADTCAMVSSTHCCTSGGVTAVSCWVQPGFISCWLSAAGLLALGTSFVGQVAATWHWAK